MSVTSCVVCPFRRTGPLGQMTDSALSDFSTLLIKYQVPPAAGAVFHQEQPIAGLYMLCQGKAKLTHLQPEGKEIILDIVSPCSILGDLPGGERTAHMCSARALREPIEVGHIPLSAAPSLDGIPGFHVGLVNHLSDRLRRSNCLLSIMHQPVERRLLKVLLRLIEGGTAGHQTVEVALPLGDIAEFAQTTPETVSRIMHRLHDLRVVRVLQGRFFFSQRTIEDWLSRKPRRNSPKKRRG